MKKINLIFKILFCFLIINLLGCKKDNTLETPKNCYIDNYEILHWDKVPYATNYRISMSYGDDISEFTTTKNEFDIFYETTEVGEYTFLISAYTSDNKYYESEYSKELKFNINSYNDCFKIDDSRISFVNTNKITGKLIIPEYFNNQIVEYVYFESDMKVSSIYMSDSITHIKPLENASNLTRIKLSENLTGSETKLFSNCPLLKEVIIPDNFETLGNDFFNNDINLEKVIIGKGVKKISGNVFSGCFNLKDVIIDKDNTYIYYDKGLFINKSNDYIICATEEFEFNCYVKGINSNAFNGLHIKEIIIPDNVLTIKQGAFSNLPLLEKIDFGLGIDELDNVITHCPNLEEVILSKNIKNISNGTFGYNSNLKKITFNEENDYYSFNNGCLIDKRTNLLVRLLGDFIIPDDITVISEGVGVGYYNDKLIIPNHIQKIEQKSFSNSSFDELILGDSVKEICNYAFSCNYSLKKVKLNDGLEIIGSSAFASCYNVNGITIPKSVKTIKGNAFSECYTSIILYNTVETIELLKMGNEIIGDPFTGCCVYYEGDYQVGFLVGDYARFYDCVITNGYLVSWTYKVSSTYKGIDKKGLPNCAFSDNFDTDKNNFIPEIPYREGYELLGFSYSADSDIPDTYVKSIVKEQKDFFGSITKEFHYVLTKDLLSSLEAGTTLYCVWKKID